MKIQEPATKASNLSNDGPPSHKKPIFYVSSPKLKSFQNSGVFEVAQLDIRQRPMTSNFI